MQTKIASWLTGATRAMACALGLLLAGTAAAQTNVNGLSTGSSTSSTSSTAGTTPTNMNDTEPTAAEMPRLPTRLVPIPPRALRALMTFNTTNTVQVRVRGRDRHMDPEKERKDYEKTLNLAPGVRIFGADNMLKLYGSLNGTYRTKFILEPATGLVMQVWILSRREIFTPDATSTTGTTTN